MSLEKAEQGFPVAKWLSNHTKVYSSGNIVYADCPICNAKKKLGVYQKGRVGRAVAVCGRCKDGGHGGGSWNGSASLTAFVALLEGCSFAQAASLVHELSGVPSDFIPERAALAKIPDSAFKCSDLKPGHRALEFLLKRGVEHLRDVAFWEVAGTYRDRVIVPIYDKGKYAGFEAKSIHKHADPKSLFSPGMDTGTMLYTASNNKGRKWVAVTESVFDAEVFRDLDVDAVGCFGGFKEGHILPLLSMQPEEVYWFLDGDAQDKVWKHITELLPFASNFIVPLGEQDDPSSLGAEGCERALLLAKKVTSRAEWEHARAEWTASY